MNLSQTFLPLIGGGLIGLAVTLMLLFNGRVTGVSGILSSAMTRPSQESLWRFMFLIGLIGGGFLVFLIQPDFFLNSTGKNFVEVIIAGLFVGYGTVMGSGCTSGHGVCGISRLSGRSMVATVTFMLFGFLTVQGVIHFTKDLI